MRSVNASPASPRPDPCATLRMQSSVRATDPARELWTSDPTRRRLSARERGVAQLICVGLKDAVIA